MTAVPSRASLLARKRDVFAAIRVLDRDQEDGAIDDDSYWTARQRYETEAAHILEEIDRLPEDGQASSLGRDRALPHFRLLAVILSGVVVAAVAVVMVSAIGTRSSAGTITGDAPTTLPAAAQAPAAVRAAEAAVTLHPKSAGAWVSLGTAYVNTAQPKLADQAYRTALKLNASNPDALSLHAMMVASSGRYAPALALVQRVERDRPTYARAWLLDGLFAARLQGHRREVIHAWQRFLVLQPRGQVSAQVRSWLTSARKQHP